MASTSYQFHCFKKYVGVLVLVFALSDVMIVRVVWV